LLIIQKRKGDLMEMLMAIQCLIMGCFTVTLGCSLAS